jgi:hypothetical protein
MRGIQFFSNNTIAQFDNKYENMVEFNDLQMNASHGIYEKYSKDQVNTIIRN